MTVLFLMVFGPLRQNCFAFEPKQTVHMRNANKAQEAMEAGRYMDALEILQELIRASEHDPESVDGATKLRAYLLAGNIYLAYNDYAKALNNYDQALKHVGDNALEKEWLLLNVAVTSCILGDEQRARQAASDLEAVKLSARNAAYQQLDAVTAKAYIEKHFGSRPKSAEYFRQSLRIIDFHKLGAENMTTPLSELYEYYLKQGPRDSTVYYLHLVDSVSALTHEPQQIAQSRRGMLELYVEEEGTENIRRAMAEYLAVMDTLYMPGRFIELNSRNNTENMQTAAQRIAALEFRISIWNMAGFSLILILVIITVWILLKRKMRLNKVLLYHKNREIMELEGRGSQTLQNPHDDDRHSDIMEKVRLTLSDPEVFCDPDLSLESLSKLIGSNSRYLSQAINETSGVNFRTYINNVRVHEACKRLTAPGDNERLTIQAIGESVGFRAHSNFVSAFKKNTGLTPSQYLKMEKQQTQAKSYPSE